ncbi:hypothetical protein P9A44_gp30 [Xanthomonas phage vB_Xar_IVIA-DoCa5]|uniref:Tail assembly protein n=1 Tax=Xanthomonas phage vB_Xar_IVIA-DoCa5 TaxID=2975532 RepID=A0A9X9JMS3_9CAUD|nr:hypothetical protein P9A44_gp30 [Xanthomonas phage vB_Xar_IVIA-DoCa5]UYA98700.1 hypothetical protein IVIADoCa5_30 [Xanthomonas phage vB_Xar_IVIA-DoCa5]
MTTTKATATADETVVRMAHLRRLGYCSSGVRAFFERHELDYASFLKDGIGEAALAATGDGMALAAIEEARDGR